MHLKDGGVFVVRLFASSGDRADGKDKSQTSRDAQHHGNRI